MTKSSVGLALLRPRVPTKNNRFYPVGRYRTRVRNVEESKRHNECRKKRFERLAASDPILTSWLLACRLFRRFFLPRSVDGWLRLNRLRSVSMEPTPTITRRSGSRLGQWCLISELSFYKKRQSYWNLLAKCCSGLLPREIFIFQA